MSLTPPLSKSDAQRAFVIADIVQRPVRLPAGEALPRDVEVLRDGLLALQQPVAEIDCRDGGAPFRFLVTQAAVQPGRVVTFTGTPRLGDRPHEPLLTALEDTLGPLGLRIERGNPWPLRVQSPPRLPPELEFKVRGAESSQFASSLLLGAARLVVKSGKTATVHLEGPLTSEGYFQLTRQWLERTGFGVRAQERSLTLSTPLEDVMLPSIPGDWSSLGYLLALSWASGLGVRRVQRGTGHPDEAFVACVERVGLRVTDRLEGEPTGGFDVDAERCPDSIPTLAALATRLPLPSVFRRVGILRVKESDRVAGILRLLAAAGAQASVNDDVLTVAPAAGVKDFRFDALDDHRLAMAATVLARLHQCRLTLRGMSSVAKSFPDFWLQAAQAQVRVEAW